MNELLPLDHFTACWSVVVCKNLIAKSEAKTWFWKNKNYEPDALYHFSAKKSTTNTIFYVEANNNWCQYLMPK